MSANPLATTASVPWWRLIDWRLVAAVGLPLWAFAFGMMIPGKEKSAETETSPPTAPVAVALPQAELDNAIPPPREVVVRPAEPVAVPIVVPVPVPSETVAAAKPPEFQLPASELLPVAQDGCQTYGTKVRFHKDPAAAMTEARASKRMLFVLHISGHFDDPGFT
jgi:hypothetical protein